MTDLAGRDRFSRRRTLLQGKRSCALDISQYHFEKENRSRLARKVRCTLRQGVDVALHTPVWSEPSRFLDDVALDLRVDVPGLIIRVAELSAYGRLSLSEATLRLCDVVREVCRGNAAPGFADSLGQQEVAEVLHRMLAAGQETPRSCLILYGVQGLPAALWDSLRSALTRIEDDCATRRVTVLLAGEGTRAPELPGALQMSLPDYGKQEAADALVGQIGDVPRWRVKQVLQRIGGVPALIEAVTTSRRAAKVAESRAAIWEYVPDVADRVRAAVKAHGGPQSVAATRLSFLHRNGPQQAIPDLDEMLGREGLVSTSRGQVTLRAPVFGDLIGSRI